MAKRKYICYSDDTTPSAGGVYASGGTGNVYPSYTGGSGSGNSTISTAKRAGIELNKWFASLGNNNQVSTDSFMSYLGKDTA